MAKLLALPELAIISGSRGKIDFYIYHPSCNPLVRGKGLPCARKWPRSPGRRRAPAVEAQWSAFAYASTSWNILAPEIRDAYNKMASGTGLTGRDMFTRSFIKGLYTYPTGG